MESEGDRQSKITVAKGDKAQVVLSSEAAKQSHQQSHRSGSQGLS